ncbi:MAG TPA: hypothetical protein VFQ76_09500 [Longimicrobiaceae bacterium]|nr:hypothetical protein [Longimicrobiaceae bacterium]
MMNTSQRIARAVIWLAMIVVAVALALDVLYYVNGSLETMPTEEDHQKVRTVTIFIGLMLVAAEVVLWLLLRRLGRTRIAPDGGGAP